MRTDRLILALTFAVAFGALAVCWGLVSVVASGAP